MEVYNGYDLNIIAKNNGQSYVLDTATYFKITINSNVSPVYSAYSVNVLGFLDLTYSISGSIGLNLYLFNQLGKFLKQTGGTSRLNFIEIDQLKITLGKNNKYSSRQNVFNGKERIYLDNIVLHGQSQTTTVDGSPTQLVYQFLLKDIRFENDNLKEVLQPTGPSDLVKFLERFKSLDYNTLQIKKESVTDGDTVNISVDENNSNQSSALYYLLNNTQNITVRMFGIDSPETDGSLFGDKGDDSDRKTNFGLDATDLMTSIFNNSSILINYYNDIQEDDYGRFVFDIYQLNQKGTYSLSMVERGMLKPNIGDNRTGMQRNFFELLLQKQDVLINNNRGIYDRTKYDDAFAKGKFVELSYDTVEKVYLELYNYYFLYLINSSSDVYIFVHKYLANFYPNGENRYKVIDNKIHNSGTVFGEVFYNDLKDLFYFKVTSPLELI